jgi:Fic family protein
VGTYTRASGGKNWAATATAARDETESRAISRYNNLLNKAADLSQKVSGYRTNRPKTTDVIRDAAKEYTALLTELAEFRKQNPPINSTDMLNLNNRINNIKDYFKWGSESWFNKNELDDFRKEFPSIFN